MTLNKQTVYLPVEGKTIGEFMDTKEGYFFTPEQLNEYTQTVIKQTLETAAEKVRTYPIEEYNVREGTFEYPLVVSKQSITNTFEQTFQKFKV